jgi:hypothetical protein
VQYRPLEQHRPQRFDQGLQVHAASTDPLRKRRARYRDARPLEDAFLSIQRLVIGVLRHQDLGEQPRGGHALVDTCAGTGAGNSVSLRAGPFASDVAPTEHAKAVVEFLATSWPMRFNWQPWCIVALCGSCRIPRRGRFSEAVGAWALLVVQARRRCLLDLAAKAARSVSMVSSSRLFCSALYASDWAANFRRFKTAISWVSLSMVACLNAASASKVCTTWRSCGASSCAVVFRRSRDVMVPINAPMHIGSFANCAALLPTAR